MANMCLVPNRPRFPPKGFEDPPPSKPEPTWYRHTPPPYVLSALQSAGIPLEQALQDLEARRDAMVEGEEWDIYIDENGKLVWKKPSEEVLKKRFESQVDLRDWGSGWRKGVVWGIWKILGSPEGVFETERGKVDGRLVLRELGKERDKGEKNSPEEMERRAPKGKEEKEEKA